jgi:Tfp pilus assembly protein FimT
MLSPVLVSFSCRSSHRRSRGFARAAGFTVMELAVSMLVLVVVLLGMLSLFDFSNRLSHVQTNVADMQQALRIAQQDAVRTIRMAGRGPLPLGLPPTGLAVSVRNNVAAGSLIGGPDTPEVLPGSDVLTVRGVFSSPIYQVNSSRSESFTLTDWTAGKPTAGRVMVQSSTPTGIPQDLAALRTAVKTAQDKGTPGEALLLVSPRDASLYAVVQLNPATSNVDNPDSFTIGFTIGTGLSDGYADRYGLLSRGGAYPVDLTSVAFVSILEEHRFYVRQRVETAPNGTEDVAPRMSRARVFPNTEEPWRGPDDDPGDDNAEHPSWQQDVADNIVDLQVALAFDTPRGGGAMTDDDNDTGDDDRIFESADGLNDDWLYNDTQAVNPVQWANQQLYYIRLTTLARTDRRDPQFQSPQLVSIEDHDLTGSRFNDRTDRMFRYRPLQTLIEMRNL